MIDETADASFMHWWLPGYEGKDALLAAGIEGEEFKSFPSGHAANGAVAMLLTAFVALKDSLRPRADLFLMLGSPGPSSWRSHASQSARTFSRT